MTRLGALAGITSDVIGSGRVGCCFACITAMQLYTQSASLSSGATPVLDTSCGGCTDDTLGGGLKAITSDVIEKREKRLVGFTSKTTT